MKIEPTTPIYSNFSRSFQKHWNLNKKQKEKKEKKETEDTSLDMFDTNTSQTELSTSKHLWYA